MDLQRERVVAGRYQLLSTLGAGGMGTVWRARDQLLGREVAVKELVLPAGLSDADRDVLRERTRREARAAAALAHPCAVTVYDVVEEGGLPYLVMELVEARTLAEVVQRDGPLSPARTAQVGLDLLGALQAAHAVGILHRDVKPSNVLVRDDGSVVLTDFGIATSTGDSSITHTGMLLGSPAYLAPERARGQSLGPASDLWSLGATLYTAVEGRPPFAGDEPLVTVASVVTGEPAPYVLAGPLAPALDGLLVKDPAQRADARATRRSLERAAASPDTTARLEVPAAATVPLASRTTALDLGQVQQQIATPRPPLRPQPVAPTGRPGRLLPVAAGVGLVVALGAGLALVTGQDDEPGSQAQPAASAAASPAPTPAAPATEPPPSPAAPEPTAAPEQEASDDLPEGWTTATGEAGWTVALPPGYTDRGGGEFRDEAGRTLRVETGPGQPDAVADREQQEAGFRDRNPSYERIRIAPADYRGYEAADWEFTYEGLRVFNRVFVVDGTGHSLFFQTREADYSAAEAEVQEIVRLFQPAT